MSEKDSEKYIEPWTYAKGRKKYRGSKVLQREKLSKLQLPSNETKREYLYAQGKALWIFNK